MLESVSPFLTVTLFDDAVFFELVDADDLPFDPDDAVFDDDDFDFAADAVFFVDFLPDDDEALSLWWDCFHSSKSLLVAAPRPALASPSAAHAVM